MLLNDVISPNQIGVEEDNYQFMGVIEDIGGASQISVNSTTNAALNSQLKIDAANPYKRVSKNKN